MRVHAKSWLPKVKTYKSLSHSNRDGWIIDIILSEVLILLMRIHKAFAASGILFSILFSGCSPQAPGSDLFSFDKLNSDLAQRVKDRILGPGNTSHTDFIVGLTTSADPIGTIYNSDTWSRAISRSDCVGANPMTMDAFYFPSSYVISRDTAVQLGLDEALTSISTFGLTADFKRGLILKFSGNKQTELDDNQVAATVRLNQVCKTSINGREVRFVRGYVSVKRDFTISSSQTISLDLGAKKVGTLKITPLAGSKEIKITDEQPANFIQIVQLVKGEPGQSTPLPQGTGTIYIQIDVADTTAGGKNLLAELKNAGLTVESHIEKIPSAQMPRFSQVRYFNEADKEKAFKILSLVRRISPEASAVRLGLPAPSGQIEVWLAK